jgi:hypothetical protein
VGEKPTWEMDVVGYLERVSKNEVDEIEGMGMITLLKLLFSDFGNHVIVSHSIVANTA